MEKKYKFEYFKKELEARGYIACIFENGLGLSYYRPYVKLEYVKGNHFYYQPTHLITLCYDDNRLPIYHWTFDYRKEIDGYFDDVDSALAYYALMGDL